MDSFTHSLLTFYLFSILYPPGELLIPIIVGAIIPDIDFLFRRLSDRNSRLFIFTHGGFTHSFTGALTISSMLTIITVFLSKAGINVPAISITLVAAFLAGSLVHIGLDILAFPGIPVFYPFSSRKRTLGIFPGPSLFIFSVTVGFLLLVVLGLQSLMNPALYLVIVIGFIIFRTFMKTALTISRKGITIPRMNPLFWFIIYESNDVYILKSYRVLQQEELLARFPKYDNVTKQELAPYLEIPEVRRHLYYSYISVVKRIDDKLLFIDPLRKERYIWYPPDYVSLEIPLNIEEFYSKQ